MEKIWLPEELKPYQVARLALGVIVYRPKTDPENPDHYQSLYDEKVLKAIEQSRELGWNPVDDVDTYLLARLDPKEDLLAQLKEVDGWTWPLHKMLMYLKKRGSLDEVKEALGRESLEEEY